MAGTNQVTGGVIARMVIVHADGFNLAHILRLKAVYHHQRKALIVKIMDALFTSVGGTDDKTVGLSGFHHFDVRHFDGLVLVRVAQNNAEAALPGGVLHAPDDQRDHQVFDGRNHQANGIAVSELETFCYGVRPEICLFDCGQYPLTGLLIDIGFSVQHPGNRAGGHAGHFGHIFHSYHLSDPPM